MFFGFSRSFPVSAVSFFMVVLFSLINVIHFQCKTDIAAVKEEALAALHFQSNEYKRKCFYS